MIHSKGLMRCQEQRAMTVIACFPPKISLLLQSDVLRGPWVKHGSKYFLFMFFFLGMDSFTRPSTNSDGTLHWIRTLLPVGTSMLR